jgi:hypothetical protein
MVSWKLRHDGLFGPITVRPYLITLNGLLVLIAHDGAEGQSPSCSPNLFRMLARGSGRRASMRF